MSRENKFACPTTRTEQNQVTMNDGLTRRLVQSESETRKDKGSTAIHDGDGEDELHVRRRPGLCSLVFTRCHSAMACCLDRVAAHVAQSMTRDNGDETRSSIPPWCRGRIWQDHLLLRLRRFANWHTVLSNYSSDPTTATTFESERQHDDDVESQKPQSMSFDTSPDVARQHSPSSALLHNDLGPSPDLPAFQNDSFNDTNYNDPISPTPSDTRQSTNAVAPEKVNHDAKSPSGQDDLVFELVDCMESRVNDLPFKPDLEVTFSPPSSSLDQVEMDATLPIDNDNGIHGSMEDYEESVTFLLRLPNSSSLQQRTIDQMQRAERTQDFLETARSLSLHLDRDKWSAKRTIRRGSMMSSSSYTSSIDTSYDASMSTSGSRPINRPPLSRTNSVTSLHELLQQEAVALRASPAQFVDESQSRNKLGYDEGLQKFDLPHQDDNNDDANLASLVNSPGKISSIFHGSKMKQEEALVSPSHRGRRAPRRNSFLAGSKIEHYDSVGNSSGNGSGQVHYGQQSPRRRSSLSGTYSGASSRRSSLGNAPENQAERDIEQQRHELGYEDVEMTMKSSTSFDTDYTSSRRSSASGGGSQLDDSYRRPRGRRAPRRSSFVAGSKIERYDGQGHSNSGSGRAGRRYMGGRRTSN